MLNPTVMWHNPIFSSNHDVVYHQIPINSPTSWVYFSVFTYQTSYSLPRPPLHHGTRKGSGWWFCRMDHSFLPSSGSWLWQLRSATAIVLRIPGALHPFQYCLCIRRQLDRRHTNLLYAFYVPSRRQTSRYGLLSPHYHCRNPALCLFVNLFSSVHPSLSLTISQIVHAIYMSYRQILPIVSCTGPGPGHWCLSSLCPQSGRSSTTLALP